MISVLIADDQALIRSAIADLITHSGDLAIAGEAADGHQALALARERRPDLVLMDIRMPGMDGIAATREICADPDLSAVRVLVLTTFEEDEYIVAALRAGASGFIGKGAEREEIAAAIRAVHRGDALLSPTATRTLIDRYVHSARLHTSEPPRALDDLTERESEVLALVGTGRSNGDIADLLAISPHTAKTHVNRIMTKLNAHDRAQLVIAAYENGLVQPGGR
ncbi:LuxR family two component transcriptional regulator [Promicromonospora sp. AC04]|uniref:response regulator transcription factor n=1 Tax=Promicromonospora sp. AC04 TaxID=2135723 RepID=UPI000D3D998E|nr:response regulator transcription factor [Promicromonospora sp. AC04]PUB20298.1 LuxR family two component transcriptional regulator [Promicromonospora sp. AC04]